MAQMLPEAVLRHMEGREMIQDCQNSFAEGNPCLIKLVTLCDGLTTLVDKGRARDSSALL